MITNENNTSGNKGSKDKIHSPELGETKDFNELSFNEEEDSYELDVKGSDKDYDHPLPYETAAKDGEDGNSDYDEQNQYGRNSDKAEDGLDDLGMHIDHGESVALSPEDEYLARTPEDEREDLDEEGYPLSDLPKGS